MFEKFGAFLLSLVNTLVNWHDVLGDAESIPPTQLWTINAGGKLTTLVDYWGLPAGSVGAFIPLSMTLPDTTKPLWLGENVNIGENCCIGAYSKIDGVKYGSIIHIGDDVNIGENVIIGNSAFNHTQIGDRVCIASHAYFPNGIIIPRDIDVKSISTQVIRSV